MLSRLSRRALEILEKSSGCISMSSSTFSVCLIENPLPL